MLQLSCLVGTILRLPAAALAIADSGPAGKEGAASFIMRPRRAVLLTPLSRSVHPAQLPSYNSPSPITPLESTLLQVFILKNLKFFRINTYKKPRGGGQLWLTKIPSRCYLPKQQVPGVSSGSSAPLESIDYKPLICNPFVFKSIQTAGGVYLSALSQPLYFITSSFPISLQYNRSASVRGRNDF